MHGEKSYWLLLEKSNETRVSKGIDGYQDRTGKEYLYDSLVPNHKNIKNGDFVVIRKENDILGAGSIGQVIKRLSTKSHRRCPKCKSTDIRERKNKTPQWKCGKCSHEFSRALERTADVQAYTATIEGFVRFDNPPTVQSIKSCALRGNGIHSQLSILKLDINKLRGIFDGLEIPLTMGIDGVPSGQGISLSYEERRAVEIQAINFAIEYYQSRGWKVVDKSKSCPFDLLALKNGQRRFVEVKGTTGDGSSIILTHGEVRHANEHKSEAVLIVVANIHLNKVDDEWITSGGKIVCHKDPWIIDYASLLPTQFRYQVPMHQDTH